MALVASAVALRRAGRPAPRKARPPRYREPIGIQHEVGGALAALVRRASESFAKRSARLLELARADDQRVWALLEVAYREGEKYLADAGPLVRQFSERVAQHNAAELSKNLRARLGAAPFLPGANPRRAEAFARETEQRARGMFRDLRTHIERHLSKIALATRRDSARYDDGSRVFERRDAEFPIEHALEHVQLISGLTKKERELLAAEIAAAHADGTLDRDLLEIILRKRFEMTETRARVVARDQVTKLEGQINADRQIAIGVTHFRWVTKRDRKVRPKHEEREDQIYAWDAPPDGEIPGQPINCRCHADPVVDNIAEILGGPPRAPGELEAPQVYRPPQRIGPDGRPRRNRRR